MLNIPPIRQSTVHSAHPVNRGAKTAASEGITADSHPIKRQLERRNRKDRRSKKVYVRYDRRQRGLYRRKYESQTENPVTTDEAVGKHINTTA